MWHQLHDHTEAVKASMDLVSAGVVVGTILGYLPAIAALLTIVWTGIRIYEWYKGKNVSDS